MSSGHTCHRAPAGVSARTIDKYMRDYELLALVHRAHSINHDYDIPYLAGYSEDGSTIYIDRHLPEELTVEEDGRKFTFRPVSYLRIHESWEKALIDHFHFNYPSAHQVATAIEHRAVLRDGIPIKLYDGRHSKLERYIKADEKEKLQKIPKDLDLTPYRDENKSLYDHLLSKMGLNEGKLGKAEAGYEALGHPASHCGPYEKWPARGECHHFIGPNRCEIVTGVVSAKGWCKHWEKK